MPKTSPLEKKLLIYFKDHPKHPWSVREIATHLKMKADGRKKIRQLLKGMSKDGRVMRLKGGRYVSRENVPTIIGRLKIHFAGYGFVIPVDRTETDVFIPARAIGHALPDDEVLVSYITKDEDGRREGAITQILQRGRSHWVGQLQKRGKVFLVVNEDFSVPIQIYVSSKKLKGARDGQVVSVKITHYPEDGEAMKGEVSEILGHPGDEKAIVSNILIRHGIETEFPKSVRSEATKLEEKLSRRSIHGRVDLRDIPLITIDGIKARDFDDAVYAKKLDGSTHLYVSIADVAHYVSSSSALDKEAVRRGTSAYFPDFAVPMLPEKLSNNLCSLMPGVDRLALTCEMRFDSKGNLTDAWYYESVINSQKRATYEEVQSFLDGDTHTDEVFDVPVKNSLLIIKSLVDKLLKHRRARGALDFDLPESEVVYDHEGEITAITQARRFFSHKLIEECMIAANVAVASLFSRSKIPCLYRVHDEPDPLKIEEFLKFLENLDIDFPVSSLKKPKDFARVLDKLKNHPMEGLLHQLFLRSMRIALYRSNNRGHFGLSLKEYSHFTSPIRRYPDLVVHRQLKDVLKKKKAQKLHLSFKKEESSKSLQSAQKPKGDFIHSREDMDYFGEISSERERQATEAEREMLSYKRAQFMLNHIGDTFYGTVRRMMRFGLFVELEPHFVQGLLHVSDLEDDYYRFDEEKMRFVGRRRKKVIHIGDRFRVQVKDVSLEQGQIFLSQA